MLRPWEPRGRCSPCLHVIYRPRQKGENGKRGGKGWRPSGWLSSFPFPRLPAWVLAGNSLCGANPVPSLPLLRPFPLHSALLLCPLSLKTSRRRCHPLPVSGQPLQRCLSVGALRNCLSSFFLILIFLDLISTLDTVSSLIYSFSEYRISTRSLEDIEKYK